MRTFCYVIFLGLFLSSFKTDSASVPAKTVFKINTDTGKIAERKFDAPALKEYKKQKEFQYHDVTPFAKQQSLWQRFWRWFWELFKRKEPSSLSEPVSTKFFDYTLLALATAGLIFIVLKVIGMGIRQLFTGKSKSIKLEYSVLDENIHVMNFEDEIDSAISNKNYRLAVRILYLGCLKKLDDAEIIKWQINKTNSDYIHELRNFDKKEQFSVLTRQFEYIWYGDFNIDGNKFRDIQSSFREFNHKLS